MQRLAGSIWQTHFHLFELNQIMRQKDDVEFAALLNRVRQGHQTTEDLVTLQNRTITTSDPEYNREALHIFATNAQTDLHNRERLELHLPIIVLTRRETRPASLKDFTVSDNPAHTGGICKTLELFKNARIIIIRNIDVQDGLVNGAQGTIIDFLPNSTNVKALLVKFDKPNIGLSARNSSTFDLSSYDKNVVPITRVDVAFPTSVNRTGLSITWTQFSVKLAFACTIHKVQGLSVDDLVVSFEKKISGGQAYVALSRCRTIHGLQNINFDPSKITQNPLVKKEMARLCDTMKLPNPYVYLQRPLACNVLTVSLLNARSLRLHFPDILSDLLQKYADILMYTETHFYNNQASQFVISQYRHIISPPDENLYHHGLACYFKNNFKCTTKKLQHFTCLEVLNTILVLENSRELSFILIYISPSYTFGRILCELKILLASLVTANNTIICGDFNVDTSTKDYLQLKFVMDKYAFTNVSFNRSHKLGSCLDHIYLSNDLKDTFHHCVAYPTYY